jgi:hypothetical protein
MYDLAHTFLRLILYLNLLKLSKNSIIFNINLVNIFYNFFKKINVFQIDNDIL